MNPSILFSSTRKEVMSPKCDGKVGYIDGSIEEGDRIAGSSE